jgi:hypothetical protein
MPHFCPSSGGTHPEHHFIPIKVFPNNLIRSHTVITMNAAPHKYLSKSFAPEVFAPGLSSGDVRAAPGSLDTTNVADESLGLEGVSFLVARCPVGSCGTSPLLVDDAAGLISICEALISGIGAAVFVG